MSFYQKSSSMYEILKDMLQCTDIYNIEMLFQENILILKVIYVHFSTVSLYEWIINNVSCRTKIFDLKTY